MLISIKALNCPGVADTSLQVSPTDTIHEVKLRLAKQLNIPPHQQKLVLRGKPLHDGSLADHQIIDGSKLHLMVSVAPPSKPSDNALTNELRALAAKWSPHPIERDAFATDFQSELKKLVDWLSLDDIERLCADRLNPII